MIPELPHPPPQASTNRLVGRNVVRPKCIKAHACAHTHTPHTEQLLSQVYCQVGFLHEGICGVQNDKCAVRGQTYSSKVKKSSSLSDDLIIKD